MTCPDCGAWAPADPTTGYDADERCPSCAAAALLEETPLSQILDRLRAVVTHEPRSAEVEKVMAFGAELEQLGREIYDMAANRLLVLDQYETSPRGRGGARQGNNGNRRQADEDLPDGLSDRRRQRGSPWLDARR